VYFALNSLYKIPGCFTFVMGILNIVIVSICDITIDAES
jgi:hypothetical protein